MAASQYGVTVEVVYLSSLLLDIGLEQLGQTKVWEDKASCESGAEPAHRHKAVLHPGLGPQWNDEAAQVCQDRKRGGRVDQERAVPDPGEAQELSLGFRSALLCLLDPDSGMG
eukprot:3761337-Rhodomonas_salina.1